MARCSKLPFFSDRYGHEVYVAAMEFDFGAYLEMMRARHPDWTDRKLRCPLYWQGHVRKDMKEFIRTHDVVGFTPLWVPEAMGVDVTETCKNAGITLQWPPMSKTYVVVLYVRAKREGDFYG